MQTNKFFVRPRPQRVDFKEFQEGEGMGGVTRKANKEILEHDRKRQTELKLLELEETLEEQGYTEEEIEERKEEYRKELEAEGLAGREGQPEEGNEKETGSHHVAARKEKMLQNMKSALGLGDVKEGEAFDRELQEQRKAERMAAREEAEKARRQRELEREKERAKEEKEEKRRRRKEEKERERQEEERREEEEAARRREKKRRRAASER